MLSRPLRRVSVVCLLIKPNGEGDLLIGTRRHIHQMEAKSVLKRVNERKLPRQIDPASIASLQAEIRKQKRQARDGHGLAGVGCPRQATTRRDENLESRTNARGGRRGKQNRNAEELVHGSNEAMEESFTL